MLCKDDAAEALSMFLESEVPLKRFLGSILPSESDVEDIAQEAFIRAYSASATQKILKPRAFLFRIAKNLAINERGRMWNKTTTFVGDVQELDSFGIGENEVSGEDRLDSHRKVKLLAEAIELLPPKCRRAFVLRKIECMSHKEIAANLNISVSTVEKHIAAGLLRCKNYLSIHGYDMDYVLDNAQPRKAH